MPSLTIEDRTGTGRPVGTITMPNVPDRITLRDLIRLRVREEVARYNLRPSAQFQGLVQPEGSTPAPRGFRMQTPRRVDWELQADAAIQSFERNGFFVMINGRQEQDLDAPIVLSDTLDVGFVRLTQLVGG
jgi:hypothetical protein